MFTVFLSKDIRWKTGLRKTGREDRVGDDGNKIVQGRAKTGKEGTREDDGPRVDISHLLP